jgi:PAS domain S-box-containing protein
MFGDTSDRGSRLLAAHAHEHPRIPGMTESRDTPSRETQRTEAFYSLVEENPFGVYVVDADFRIRQISAGARKVFSGFQDVRGLDLAHVLRELWPGPFATEAIERFRHTLSTGESYTAASTSETRKDTAELEAYDWRISRILLPDDRFGVICYFYDLSERQRWEREIRESEERLRIATQATGVGIWSWDPGTGIVMRQTPDLSVIDGGAFTDGSAFARLDLATVNPDDTAGLQSALERTVRDGSVLNLTVRTSSADGATRWLRLFGARILDAASETLRVVGTVHDVTEETERVRALGYSEQLHRESFDLAPTGMAYVDLDGRLTRVNAMLAELSGYQGHELLAMSLHDLFEAVGQAADGARSAPQQSRQLTHPGVTEGTLRRKDGSVRWIVVRLSNVTGSAGDAVHRIATIEDVTSRKVAEMQLMERERFTRSLLDASPSLVFVYDVHEQRALYINDQIGTALGMTAEQVSSESARLFTERIHPDDAPLLRAHLDARARDANERSSTEYRLRHADGSWRWFESRMVVFARDTAGRASQILGVATDITDRRADAAKLVESEQRVRLATETTGVGIWQWNLLTGEISWDAPMFAMYGVEPTRNGRIQYETWSTAVLPEDLPEQERVLRETVARRGQSRRSFRIRRADTGEVRYIEAVETVRLNAEGAIEWVLGTNLDVTERTLAANDLTRLAAELAAADRRKDEFLATLAHELRNPLSPMSNGLQIIRLAEHDPAARENARTMIERQLTQLVRIVDDLLDISRISGGKIQLRRERVEIDAILQVAIETSRPLLEAGRQQLRYAAIAGERWVSADPTRLVQVFANLINNASKFSDPGACVSMAVEDRDDMVCVRIADTGIGIDAETLPRIFDMFAQADRSLERSRGGLGIGLTLVKELIQMHGGTVEASSDGLGQGSVFTVCVPRCTDATGSAARAGAASDPSAAPHDARLRILIADDNSDAAASLGEILSARGHTVSTVDNGRDAVAMSNAAFPQLVLMDLAMPHVNGFDACRQIKAAGGADAPIVIAISGWGTADDRGRSRAAGFDDHLVKPVSLAAIDRLLAEWGAVAIARASR